MDRADKIISDKFNITRSRVKKYIDEEKIIVDGKILKRAGMEISSDAKIEILEDINYVARSAYKLKKALDVFGLTLNGVCMDIGASTGGFTQVLLEYGAKKVYAVDVGTNQLHTSILNDIRIVSIENTDIRDIDIKNIEDKINFVSVDISFISLKKIYNKLLEINAEEYIILIKPQFEAGKEIMDKTEGVVLDKNIHKKIIEDIVNSFDKLEFVNITFSPNRSKRGNIEYLVYFKKKDKFSNKQYMEQNINLDIVDEAFKYYGIT